MSDRDFAEDLPLGSSTDVTPDLPTPADFDVDSWLAGVRRPRRAVVLYQRADLLARMDEIVAQIEALPDGDEVDALIDEYEELRDEFKQGRTFVVEGRSQEWVAEFRKRRLAAMGVRKGEGDRDQKRAALLDQLAEQIVTPHVTAEQLDRLEDVANGELMKLVVAMEFANQQVAESAGVLKLDFSSRRSGTTRR